MVHSIGYAVQSHALEAYYNSKADSIQTVNSKSLAMLHIFLHREQWHFHRVYFFLYLFLFYIPCNRKGAVEPMMKGYTSYYDCRTDISTNSISKDLIASEF